MDEEEYGIERNINDSKEQVDDKSNSKEGVDNISDSKEGVDGISNYDEPVDAESEENFYRDYVLRNDFETMNVFE